MVFSTEPNTTYAAVIDEFFVAKQGDFIESTPVGRSIMVYLSNIHLLFNLALFCFVVLVNLYPLE